MRQVYRYSRRINQFALEPDAHLAAVCTFCNAETCPCSATPGESLNTSLKTPFICKGTLNAFCLAKAWQSGHVKPGRSSVGTT